MRKNILSKLNFDRTAFTLIEISVAIAIVGIIAALIIVGTSGTRNSAYDAKRKGDVEMLEKTILTYQAYAGSVPVSATACDLKQDGTGCAFTSSFTPTYITTIPTDPANSSVYYRYSSTDGSAFTVQALLSDGFGYSCSSVGNVCALTSRNFVNSNLSNGCENGATTGFSANMGGEVFTSDTTEHWQGSRSLKCVTTSTNGSGFYTSQTVSNLRPNMEYTASAYVKGAGTVRIYLRELLAGGGTVGSTNSANVVLTSSWQRISVKRAFGSTGVGAMILIVTQVGQVSTFYTDGLQLEAGGETRNWVVGQ
ncbi:MAG: carbohydrate binding domain-containing protein [Candidatus Paceibacterota bacterium]